MKDEGPEELRSRTRRFAVAIVRFCSSLPRTMEAQTMGRQLLKAGTSVGAHYREARRAKSDADFISKIEGALQELDETAYWLEIFADTGIGDSSEIAALAREANELTGILVRIVRTVKNRPPR